jgi:polysaccharide biosynthesis/export protein
VIIVYDVWIAENAKNFQAIVQPFDPSLRRLFMQVGRFCFARSSSLFALSIALILNSQYMLAQDSGKASAPESPAAVPAAQPISQVAAPASRVETQPAKSMQQIGSGNSLAMAGMTSPLLKLGPGDLIEVSVYNVPELSTKARIGSSGEVYLPLIDYVHIGNLTVNQAQSAIQKRLEDGGFVHNAHVTVTVDESAAEGVTIIGEVVKPGIYPALGERKLYDYISAAGGFTSAAGRKLSIIRQEDQPTAINVDLSRNFADNLRDNIEILPGDTITVPRAPIIYVVGDVGRPTGLLVDNGSLTVLQALALAGGTNHTAKIGSVRIIRKGPAGMTETKVPLKKMLEAKVPDVTLQADDILFIPISGARIAAAQGMQAAISAATGIAVIAAHP